MIDSHTLNIDTLTATAQPLWYVGWLRYVYVCVCVRGNSEVMVKEAHTVLWLMPYGIVVADAVVVCGDAFDRVWANVYLWKTEKVKESKQAKEPELNFSFLLYIIMVY